VTSAFDPEDLDCPRPQSCPVAVRQLSSLAHEGRLPTVTPAPGSGWSRVHHARYGYAEPNPGFGDSRFAPFDAADDGHRVPTLYLAETPEAALLETALHGVSEWARREVAELGLLGLHHAQLLLPGGLTFADLRDPQLQLLGLERSHLASSSAEHYPCTRTVAKAVHASKQALDGILWHSRQTELNGRHPAEVMVIFADRPNGARNAWSLAAHVHASGSLLEGAGRLWLDELADQLNITIFSDE
jgi:hypothetical protein